MDQEDLKPIMRAQELQRRATRLQVIKNHSELNDYTPEERQLLKVAIEGKRGYWRRLWDAIRNK